MNTQILNSQIVFDLLFSKIYHDRLEEIVEFTLNSTDALSYNNLGYLYYTGIGLTKDIKKAEESYLKSIELGNNSWAMCNLGTIHRDILKNYKEAEKWYIKSIELGNIYAMIDLGSLYWDNLKDPVKTEEWLLKSAELGNYLSMNNLGVFYYYHSKDYVKSEEWYLKCIEGGYSANSLYNIGVLYFKLERYTEALEYLQKIKNIDKTDKIVELINICLKKTKKLDKIYTDVEIDNCVVCLESLKYTNKGILTLVCGHAFHYECIKYKDNCSLCRN